MGVGFDSWFDFVGLYVVWMLLVFGCYVLVGFGVTALLWV